jgi:hypothetical protein
MYDQPYYALTAHYVTDRSLVCLLDGLGQILTTKNVATFKE